MKTLHAVIKRIAPYMKSKGFFLSGKNFCHIANDIAYCIALDMPGGLIYVTAYIMPLYVPCDCRYYTYGYRINHFPESALPLLRKDADDKMLCAWSDMLCQHIEENVIPFYGRIGTPRALAESLIDSRNPLAHRFSCAPVFSQRLLAYTYLYLREYDKASRVIARYHNMLQGCTHLTKTTVQKYLDEVDVIQMLAGADESEVSEFFSRTIEATRSTLGSKRKKGQGDGLREP